MLKDNEINALVALIDDPDDRVYQHIREKLLDIGEPVIPMLENYWEQNQFGLTFQDRIETLIHEIQFESVRTQLEGWSRLGGKELLKGVLLVNKYQYPELDEAKIKRKLYQLKQDIWLELHDNLTAFEKVRIINQILFDVHGLSGNKKNYHAPQNSYLNIVLETGKGNPLALSIIYMLLCEMLEIPVYGINLPNHFVLAYLDELKTLRELENNEMAEDGILFYINPFSRGTIFNRKEIDQFLSQIKIAPRKEFFVPCSHISIIKRLITNLIYAYEKVNDAEKAEELRLLYRSVDAHSLPEGTA